MQHTFGKIPRYVLLFFMLLSCHFLAAQSATGTVVDAENQEPIIGASILEKGTNNGTITDFDGHFELNLTTEDPVLVISYVGFQSQEAEYTGEELFIELTGGLALDEVVVTALGIKRERKALGYSVQEIGGADLVVARERSEERRVGKESRSLRTVKE